MSYLDREDLDYDGMVSAIENLERREAEYENELCLIISHFENIMTDKIKKFCEITDEDKLPVKVQKLLQGLIICMDDRVG